MSLSKLPPLWLIVFALGLSLLSETVYTPSLPEIAHALKTTDSMVEYTLTIYLFGFSLGTLFWGHLSDRVGRKPCMIAGLFIFAMGCIGCFYAPSITALLLSRLIQSFGGSVGSVLGQAINRDAFHGPALVKAYATASISLAFFPAIGPLIGGTITELYDWPFIFLFLITVTLILIFFMIRYLPETHQVNNRKKHNLWKVALKLLRDKRVLGFGIIVGACNGISFSYYAEGSFYLIELLGLSPTQYGATFIAIAASTMIGGLASQWLNRTRSPIVVMGYGLYCIAIAAALFSSIALWNSFGHTLPRHLMIAASLFCQMGIVGGICMVCSNALALALVDYKWCSGTASSLFGGFYYALISLVTLGMGFLHNGTLLLMPLYFLAMALVMLVAKRKLIREI